MKRNITEIEPNLKDGVAFRVIMLFLCSSFSISLTFFKYFVPVIQVKVL